MPVPSRPWVPQNCRAEFLNLSYTYVMLAAIVPAFLYYLGLLFAVQPRGPPCPEWWT